MLGRAPALGMLLAASRNLPSLVYVEGRYGVGKTRLVTEFLGRPELSGIIKVSGPEVAVDNGLRHELPGATAALEGGIRLARQVPTVAVVDDVHLRSDRVRSLVAGVAGNPPPHLCLVLTCDPDRLGQMSLLDLLGPLRSECSLWYIDLKPLTEEEVRLFAQVMLGQEISQLAAKRLLHETGGIPRALTYLLGLGATLAPMPEGPSVTDEELDAST
jgi:hypothetical protein